VSGSENIFDIALIGDETNRYAQQDILKSVNHVMFCFRIRKCKDVTVDKMYLVLALFMLMDIVQKPTLYYSRTQDPPAIHSLYFSEPLPLDRLEVIIRCMHFSDNGKQNEFQGPPKLFRIYPVIQHLNKFQNLLYLNQNIVIDKSLTMWKGHLSFRQHIPLPNLASKHYVSSLWNQRIRLLLQKQTKLRQL
jgi:hypothetical protein